MRNAVLLSIIIVVLFPVQAAIATGAGGGDISFTPKNAAPVQFSHDYHLKQRGLKCVACHFQKFSRGTGYEMRRESITKNNFCEHCHNGMKAFNISSENNCIRCHKK